MRGAGRKASFLGVMAVMATALLGAAYTLWYENINVTANVATGTLDGRIICGGIVGDNDGININGDIVIGPGDIPGGTISGYPVPIPDKDVGHVISSQVNDHEVLITVTNAYPGYAIDCEFELSNIGSVMWHVETEIITVDVPVGDPYGDYNSIPCLAGATNCVAGSVGPTNPLAPPIYVRARNIQGCQIHPGTDNDESGSIIIGVNQSAIESSTYIIKLTFQINQWNESGWYGCRQDNPNRIGPVLPT